MRKYRKLADIVLVSAILGISSAPSAAGDDRKLTFAEMSPEQDFEYALAAGDIDRALAAIARQEEIENAEIAKIAEKGASGSSLKGGSSGDQPTTIGEAAFMFERLVKELDEADYAAIFDQFPRSVIPCADGVRVQRLRPLPKGRDTVFQIDVRTAGKISVTVEAKYQNAAYDIELVDASGRSICRSGAPTTRFDCSWQSASTGKYRLKITSQGPLPSMLQVSVH